MATKKQYASPDAYEAKLIRVMERFGTEDYNYNWDRHMAWVEFRIKGQLYRFDYSIEKAQAKGINVVYGSDVFAKIVLALERLAKMKEDGIYEIETWLAGMKFLPPPVVVPECFKVLGFTEIPADIEDVKARYKTLAKQAHPDSGGTKEAFIALQTNAEAAIKWMESKENTNG